MIFDLKVDGFKSLDNLHLKLNPGLNVLVGPNGAGKSNICNVFNLLSSLVVGETSSYFIHHGGPEDVFSRNKKKKHIRIHLKGIAENWGEGAKHIIHYEYFIEIKKAATPCITQERLIINEAVKKEYSPIIEIAREGQGSSLVEIYNSDLVGNMGFSGIAVKPKLEHQPFRYRISLPVTEDTLRYTLLNHFKFIYSICDMVARKIGIAQIISIKPSLASQPSHPMEPVLLDATGKNLANVIYRSRHEFPTLISTIEGFLRNILPEFKDFIAKEENGRRTFLVRDKFNRKWPAHMLSDGTIKLIALLCGAVGTRHLNIIIEEPENYLHPLVCKELVGFLREIYLDDTCVGLLTTHSETVLNAVAPEEIIVVERNGLKTTANRVKDASLINNIINKTGFGCGYHYVAGSLGGSY